MKRLFAGIAVCAALCGVLPLGAGAEEVAVPGDLIKGSSPVVYYYYGKRYAFPDEAIYRSWYADFSKVKTVSDAFLASVPLAGNVRFRPGEMVKLTTDPKVYLVHEKNTLRWIPNEAAANALFGEKWASKIHPVDDTFFGDYTITNPVAQADIDAGSFAITKLQGVYRGHADALTNALPAPVQPSNPFASASGFVFANAPHEFGVTGSSTQPLATTKATVEALSSGWAKKADIPILLFATSTVGHILGFTQPRGMNTAYRTVILGEQGADVAVNVMQGEIPSDTPMYPALAVYQYQAGNGVAAHTGAVMVSREEMDTWARTALPAAGWDFVTQREYPPTTSFATTVEWVFRHRTNGQWYVLEYLDDPFGPVFFGPLFQVRFMRVSSS